MTTRARISVLFFLRTLVPLVLCLPVYAEGFQYVYDETGQLIKAIDSTGTVIEYPTR